MIYLYSEKNADRSYSIRIYLYGFSKMCGLEVVCSKKLNTPWSIDRKFTVLVL